MPHKDLPHQSTEHTHTHTHTDCVLTCRLLVPLGAGALAEYMAGLFSLGLCKGKSTHSGRGSTVGWAAKPHGRATRQRIKRRCHSRVLRGLDGWSLQDLWSLPLRLPLLAASEAQGSLVPSGPSPTGLGIRAVYPGAKAPTSRPPTRTQTVCVHGQVTQPHYSHCPDIRHSRRLTGRTTFLCATPTPTTATIPTAPTHPSPPHTTGTLPQVSSLNKTVTELTNSSNEAHALQQKLDSTEAKVKKYKDESRKYREHCERLQQEHAAPAESPSRNARRGLPPAKTRQAQQLATEVMLPSRWSLHRVAALGFHSADSPQRQLDKHYALHVHLVVMVVLVLSALMRLLGPSTPPPVMLIFLCIVLGMCIVSLLFFIRSSPNPFHWEQYFT